MKRVLKFLKPYTFFIIVAMAFSFVQSYLNLKLPDYMSDIVDNGIVGQSIEQVLNYGKKMLIVSSISALCAVCATFIASRVSAGFAKKARHSIYEKVEEFSLNEFNKIPTSSLITRTTNDVTQIQHLVLMTMRMMIMAPMMCIGGMIMAISTNKKLSIIFTVAIPILLVLIVLLAKKVLPLFSIAQKRTDRLNQVVREKLTGVRVIRAFGTQDYEKERFDVANKNIYEISLKAGYIMALLMPLIFFCINISSVIIVWIGANQIDLGTLQIGEMMAFIQYAMQVLFSVLMVSMMFVLIPRAIVSVKRINEVLEIEPSIKDDGKISNKDDVKAKGEIEFDNVEFSYYGSNEPVLKHITFKVNKGETLAIIGGTGSGKTTLVNLILRFYEATAGNIKIGGEDIKDIKINTLREMIAYVPQKSVLFSGTIAENIKYGKQDATEDEVLDAAKVSQSYEFISELEDKFDSRVSQGGTNYSGGQKQRIAIARAIIRKPDIYIFDDSFSALDYKTDRVLREELNKYAKGATKVIVAQRVSTVMNADKILLIDDGKILAQGTHKELFNNCKEYKELVLSQITEEEAMQSGK